MQGYKPGKGSDIYIFFVIFFLIFQINRGYAFIHPPGKSTAKKYKDAD